MMAHSNEPKASSTAVKQTGSANPEGGSIAFDASVASSTTRVLRQTNDLIAASRYEDAYSTISSTVRAHPEYRDFLADSIIKTELLAGHNDLALKDAIIRVSQLDGSDQSLYLSLASAASGQVYPGQAEFCVDQIQEHLKNQGLPPASLSATGSLNAKLVTVLSALALGTKSAPEFLELTLKLDPANDLAARQAITEYTFKGRYSDVRRIASQLASRLPAGDARDYYTKTLAAVANLKDKPQHPVINP